MSHGLLVQNRKCYRIPASFEQRAAVKISVAFLYNASSDVLPCQPREAPKGTVAAGEHTVQNFGPETTAIVYGLQNRAVQVCRGDHCFKPTPLLCKDYSA